MAMDVTCDQCGSNWDARDVSLKKRQISLLPEGTVMQTYWCCPRCGYVYTVMIDDEKTLYAERRYGAMLDKLQTINRRGKQPTESQVEHMQNLAKQLRHKRDQLNKRYNGSFYQIGDVKHQLEIRVPDVKLEGE